MYRVASLGAITCSLGARRNAGRLSQYPGSFSLAPLRLLATRIGRVLGGAYDRTAFHSWFLHSRLLVHVGEAVERRRFFLASRGGRNRLWESAGTLRSWSGARTRVGSTNQVRVVRCRDQGHIALYSQDPSKQTLPGFTPCAVAVTIALDLPLKMSKRHVGRKRPDRERLIAPRAVSHLHLVQADVIVEELGSSTQPATPHIDKVRIRREQLPRALHVVRIPGALPTVGQHCRSVAERWIRGCPECFPPSSGSPISISVDPTARSSFANQRRGRVP